MSILLADLGRPRQQAKKAPSVLAPFLRRMPLALPLHLHGAILLLVLLTYLTLLHYLTPVRQHNCRLSGLKYFRWISVIS
jgi:hypothetical protein